MPRNVNVALEKDFRRGLITESTGLNFPVNACTETFDCVFDEKARVKRRFGFEYEANFIQETASRLNAVVSGYTWHNVGGDGSVSVRVQQIGDTLYFYNITSAVTLSTNLLADTIDLNDFASEVTVDPGINECQFTAGNGFLIVTHPECEPFYVEIDIDTENVTATEIVILIRDFTGLDDGLEIDERPTATVAGLTDEHHYNLYNQGWYFDSGGYLADWDAARTDMPSNADVWWHFKNADDIFDTTTIDNVYMGTSPAPAGHYILDVHDQDRATASGLTIATGDPVTTGTRRVATCGFGVGRVFYAGLSSPGYASNIYFTQIIESPDQFGYCYQINDPTSEQLFDLLPTDGGVITVFGMESVVKIWPLNNVVIVFATNGIWGITGSDGIGFTANDYTVTKISSISSLGPRSFVDVDGFPVWWNLDGIFSLIPSQDSASGFVVKALTDDSIRTFYNDIPMRSKRLARGDYNPVSKVASWIYRSTDGGTPETDSEFDRVLNFNLLTQAWYPWTIGDTNVFTHDIFVIKGEGGVTQIDDVKSNGGVDNVQSDAGDEVIIFSLGRILIEPKFKFFVSEEDSDPDYNFTFAENRSTAYVDWIEADPEDEGENYESYFITGYRIDGNTQNFFQSNYVFVFLEQEEDASCFMQGVWDWTTSDSSNKWSSLQQIYNENLLNRSVNFRRLKVRGKGRSLQLRFESEEGKPFTIIGWSIWETANASI